MAADSAGSFESLLLFQGGGVPVYTWNSPDFYTAILTPDIQG